MGTTTSTQQYLSSQYHLHIKSHEKIPLLKDIGTFIVEKKALLHQGVVSSVWIRGEVLNSYQLQEVLMKEGFYSSSANAKGASVTSYSNSGNSSSASKKPFSDASLMPSPPYADIRSILKELHTCVSLCCQKNADDGIPHEHQLLSFMDSFSDTQRVKYYYTDRHHKAYSEDEKYTMTLGKHLGNSSVAFALGAVEDLVPQCDSILTNASSQPAEKLTQEWRNKIQSYCEGFQSSGSNLFALAKKDYSATDDSTTEERLGQIPSGMTLLGMILVKDTMKPDVNFLLKECARQNLTVVFTSEDSLTATKKQAEAACLLPSGMDSREKPGKMYSGEDIRVMPEKQWRDIDIFSTPLVVGDCSTEDREHLISRFMNDPERSGKVLVTGDNAGDVPSMLMADVSAAFHSSCTIAKVLSDAIMEHDHFSSLVNSVLYARKHVEVDEEKQKRLESTPKHKVIPVLTYREHLMPLDLLVSSNPDSHLSSSFSKIAGLTTQEAEKRKKQSGLNSILVDVSSSRPVQSADEKKPTSEFMQNLVPSTTTVLRDGKESQISSLDLVQGDIVVMRAGEHVPADVRVVYCSEEAQISKTLYEGGRHNGHVLLSVESTHDANPFLSNNMAFTGCWMKSGMMCGFVVKTGAQTALGQFLRLSL